MVLVGIVIWRSWPRCKPPAALRAPAVFCHVEHNAVDILELVFGIDTWILRQLHEELAAVLFDILSGGVLVIDDEAKVVQSRIIGSTLAAAGARREVQQGQ